MNNLFTESSLVCSRFMIKKAYRGTAFKTLRLTALLSLGND
ncbi:hypothetical protein VIBHAR_04923 [Vibrio campbellii ATCC BAA-1116]|uniref:Uncharacterized protein n=1 Tax=Vibrio campbellii (strain ATCC BAA-1116) TaxID=2902295 RepID=A7N786_VIBC1|nr:hypothetical protein VIBHAR_04923 [Vibrio campbellii ATCC BAA-1116]